MKFKIRQEVIHIPTSKKCEQGEIIESNSPHDFATPYFVEETKSEETISNGGNKNGGNKNITKKKRM